MTSGSPMTETVGMTSPTGLAERDERKDRATAAGTLTIAVTFALPGEFAPWQQMRAFTPCTDVPARDPVRAYETQIHTAGSGIGEGDSPDRRRPVDGAVPRPVRLHVVITGIGHTAATAAAATVFHPQPDLCIVAGTAGGLVPALRVPDVVAARRVRGADGRMFECDPRLVALAIGCGAAPIETLHSAPAIVWRAEEKRRLHEREAADAVDMESAAILAECVRRGIPGLALRSISDAAETEMPIDLNAAVTASGGVSVRRLLAAIARRPQAIPALVHLARESRRASTTLAACLDRLVARIAIASDVRPAPDGSTPAAPRL